MTDRCEWIICDRRDDSFLVLDEFKYYQSVYGELLTRKEFYDVTSPFLMDSQLNKTSSRIRRKKVNSANVPSSFLERCDRVQAIARRIKVAFAADKESIEPEDQRGNGRLKDTIKDVEGSTNNLFSDCDFSSVRTQPLNEGDVIKEPTDEAIVYENSGESVIMTLAGDDHILYCPPGSSFLMGHVKLTRHLVTSGQTFDFILMDPPWQNRSVKRKHTYSMFDETDLAELRIPELLSEKGLLAMWVTNSYKAQAAAKKIIGEWGLQIIATWHWLKVTKSFDPVYQFVPHHKVPFESVFIACRPHSEAKYECISNDFCFASVPHGSHSKKPPLHAVFQQFGFNLEGKNLELYARCLQSNFLSVGYEPLRFQSKVFFTLEGDPHKR
uniref:Methyltransferase-like protein 4 n=1 Tax=Steinernema glaseri TaxID=37863 RepID=A0A1I7YQY9_9BILA